MIIQLPVPSEIAAVVHTAIDLPSPSIHQDEELLIGADTIAKRRLDFSLGRACAREALQKLGLTEQTAILKGAEGEPLWPVGFLGSIAHTKELAVALVAKRSCCAALGVDVEHGKRELRQDITRAIATSAESIWIEQSPTEKQFRTLALFSAKESTYKALFPICRTFFGFADVELTWNAAEKSFLGQLVKSLHPRLPAGFTFQVNCHEQSGYIFTYLIY